MTFATELLNMTGAATDTFDIRAGVRCCYLYDFVGTPVRLWDGQGKLVADGENWLGTFDAMGNNRHKAPAYQDSRNGTSPRLEFALPYIDEDTYNSLNADQALCVDRDLICYHVLCKAGEGLIPTTELRFYYRLVMRGAQFSKSMVGEREGARLVWTASVIAKSLEYGRSRVPNGTYTDTAQVERARILGVSPDTGCSMVARNSRRTYIVPGG